MLVSPPEENEASAEVGRSRFAPLVHALAATAGRAALQRGLTFYMGIGVVGAIVFEGNGLPPSTLTRQALETTPFRLGLWGLWLLVTTPAARAVLCTPSSFFLRALPIPRWRFFVVQGAMLMIVQLPWLWLWTRGSGPAWGMAAAIAGAAGHCALVARPQRPLEVAMATLLVGALVVGARSSVLASVGLAAAIVFLRAAWLRAPEQPRTRDWPIVAGPAAVALLLAYFASLGRRHGTLVLRAFIFTASAIGVTYVVARNNRVVEGDALSTLLLTLLAPSVAIALVGFATPVLRMEQSARWILDSCGVSRRVRMASEAGAIALWGLLLGFAQGLAAATLLRPARGIGAWLVLEGVLAGASLGLVSMQAARFTTRWNGRDAARTLVVMLLVLVVTVALVRIAHAWSMALWSGAALLSMRSGVDGTSRDLHRAGAIRRSTEG